METTGKQKQSRRKIMASYSFILYAQHIGSKKNPTAPKILDSLNKLMQRTANENATGPINIMIVM